MKDSNAPFLGSSDMALPKRLKYWLLVFAACGRKAAATSPFSSWAVQCEGRRLIERLAFDERSNRLPWFAALDADDTGEAGFYDGVKFFDCYGRECFSRDELFVYLFDHLSLMSAVSVTVRGGEWRIAITRQFSGPIHERGSSFSVAASKAIRSLVRCGQNVKTVATEGAGESPTEAAQPSSQK